MEPPRYASASDIPPGLSPQRGRPHACSAIKVTPVIGFADLMLFTRMITRMSSHGLQDFEESREVKGVMDGMDWDGWWACLDERVVIWFVLYRDYAIRSTYF